MIEFTHFLICIGILLVVLKIIMRVIGLKRSVKALNLRLVQLFMFLTLFHLSVLVEDVLVTLFVDGGISEVLTFLLSLLSLLMILVLVADIKRVLVLHQVIHLSFLRLLIIINL